MEVMSYFESIAGFTVKGLIGNFFTVITLFLFQFAMYVFSTYTENIKNT